MQINKLGKMLKLILIIGGVLYIPAMIYCPFLLHNSKSTFHSMIMIYPNGILMLGVIYEFIRLFRKIEDNNPFTMPTVNILKQTGVITFIMSIIWLLDLVFMITIMKNTYINYILVLLFLCILFLGVSIALYMLSVLIKQATEYKEENDLTI